MDLSVFFFLVFSASLLVTAALVVFLKNPVHSVVALVFSFVSAAAMWLLLKAEFLATIMVLVYVGAVMVLFLFVVMMIGRADPLPHRSSRSSFFIFSPLVVLLIFSQLVYALFSSNFGFCFYAEALPHEMVGVDRVGYLLFTRYFYPFELASILLFLGVLSAVVLAYRTRRDQKRQDKVKQLAVTPADRLGVARFPRSNSGGGL